jgi:hypothetical protein
LSPLHANIETVESAYEFLLAYAAQGRDDDTTGSGPRVRDTLVELDAALVAIVGALDDTSSFNEVIRDDVHKSRSALQLVLAQAKISSELIDNLNASIHLRAALTDLFLLSESQP